MAAARSTPPAPDVEAGGGADDEPPDLRPVKKSHIVITGLPALTELPVCVYVRVCVCVCVCVCVSVCVSVCVFCDSLY